MKKLIIILPFLLSLTSCSYYAFYPQPRSQTYLPTNPDSIKVYSGDIDQEYDVIGAIATYIPLNIGNDKSNGGATGILKKHTAKLGADAIINLKITPNSMSGVAVKFK